MTPPDEMQREYTKRLTQVEEALASVFPRRTDPAWAERIAGEPTPDLDPAHLDRINAPGWTLLERGGKRWRPLVLLLAHDLYGGGYRRVLELSTLVELPHNGSLIVDDIEDKAEERRGGPAIHLVHGVDMAINTGNFLYFEPTWLFEDEALPEARRYPMVRAYLRVMRRLHLGQGLDIVWHNDHGRVPPVAEYLQMCRYKTGALSRLAAELGALAAGAPDDEAEALGRVWEDLGVGFQILDDVKNLTTGNPGKLRGDDIVEGKKSLPVLVHAVRAADGGASLLALFDRVTTARGQGDPLVPLIEQAIGLMEASGALDEAYRQGEALLAGGLDRLKGRWSGPAVEAMAALVATFWEGLKK